MCQRGVQLCAISFALKITTHTHIHTHVNLQWAKFCTLPILRFFCCISFAYERGYRYTLLVYQQLSAPSIRKRCYRCKLIVIVFGLQLFCFFVLLVPLQLSQVIIAENLLRTLKYRLQQEQRQ